MAKLRIQKDLENSIQAGSIIKTDAVNEPMYLPPGANGTILTIVANTPQWVTNINNNENLVVPTLRNNVADFTAPHGTLVHNDRMYISTRGGVTPSMISKLLVYPNCADLSIFTSISLPTASTSGLDWNLDSICYDPVTDKIIGPITETSNLLVANANNIAIFTIVPVAMASNFGTTPPIVTDGVGNIFTVIAGGGVERLVKIDTTTLTVIASVILPGLPGIHGGGIDVVNGFAYFTGIGSSDLYKVNTATLAFTTVALGTNVFTDDLLFFPGSFGVPNMIIAGSENQGTGNRGAVIVDVDTMTPYFTDLLPSYGIFYDAVNDMLVNLSSLGFIETVPMSSIIEVANGNYLTLKNQSIVYTARGFRPNEYMVTSCGVFITSYEDGPTSAGVISDGLGRLLKISLLQVDNPIITKTEALFRSTQV